METGASPGLSADKPLQVLVAEDDPVARRLVEATLQRKGVSVTSVEDGLAAWDTIRKTHHDVLISDYQMPGLDGFGLTRRIRAAHFRKYTYIILLTVMGGKSNHLEAIAAGADDFLTKPLDPDVLYTRLHVAQRILGLQHHVKQLEGLLHICASCKKIRDENENWTQLESYISQHVGIMFSHGMCPPCAARWEAEAGLV